MKRTVIGSICVATTLGVAALFSSLSAPAAQATAAAGFTGKTVATGTFGPVFSHVHVPKQWDELLVTRGKSDLYVQDNTWTPGGSTGWHTHPGPSLVIVTEGTVTTYDADGRRCERHVYTAGTTDNTFVDPGDGHVHLIRNETTLEAKTMAVQLIPAGATRRQDVPTAPAACPGIS